jgi:N-acetylglucosaminyldiphosphoundecaprenol N-acetyl-beta-D-mannosaminyltransferase
MTEVLVPRADVLGVRVSAIRMGDAISVIERWIAERSQNYVCVTGAHGVISSRADAELRGIHNRAGLVTPDGMPVVWMSRALGFKRTERVRGADLMATLSLISAQRGYRQFYYGGAPGVGDRLASRLSAKHPNLQIAGTFTPPFRKLTPDEDENVVRLINEAQPDIVWVGLSTPKQEFWMAEHAGRIEAPAMIGVGAAFDFLAGLKTEAPGWMQRSGLEWVHRLSTEPKRLGPRYASIVPRFIALAALQLLREARGTKRASSFGG